MTTPEPHKTPQYIYGIVRVDAAVPDGLTGLDDQPVAMVSHKQCAALVSDVAQDRPLGERADLVAHQKVLDAFVAAGITVVPFRFGAAVSSRKAVEEDLLAESGERLAQILEQLEGRHELRVKGTYVEDAVLREVMTEEPQVAELNQRLRGIPDDAADAAYYDRVRLGEMVAESIKRRRENDGARLLEHITPMATAVVPHVPAREEDVLDASFLVDRERLKEFEQAVNKLAQDCQDRIRIRLIGPLPPYDFVPEK